MIRDAERFLSETKEPPKYWLPYKMSQVATFLRMHMYIVQCGWLYFHALLSLSHRHTDKVLGLIDGASVV